MGRAAPPLASTAGGRRPRSAPTLCGVFFSGTRPVDWVLPGLLGVTWLLLWPLRRGIPPWFYVVGLLLAVLCIPVGMVASALEVPAEDCTPDNLCLYDTAVTWLINGELGFITVCVLAPLTFVVMGVLLLVRSLRATESSLDG